jgi:hypothetical protein
MAVERDLSKILAMPDDDLFRWRANAKEESRGGDAQLSVLLAASLDEVVERAGRAWSAASRIRRGP